MAADLTAFLNKSLLIPSNCDVTIAAEVGPDMGLGVELKFIDRIDEKPRSLLAGAFVTDEHGRVVRRYDQEGDAFDVDEHEDEED